VGAQFARYGAKTSLMGPETQHDEKALIEAAQEDPSRFAELYELHFQRVYAYIARRVGERSAVEELTAHVFQQALANLKSFKWRGAPFAAWLFRIAANAIADRAQRARRESPAEPREIEAQAALEVNLEQVETLARINGLVEQLSWDQRRVIRARFVEEKSIREIATELSRSEGAIKQLQFRALQTLRARLSKEDV
jgi:RNA polymerase sigma-70 factor (ECF subfamily)